MTAGRLWGAALALYMALAAWIAATKSPWCDEAWFSGAAVTLADKGYMGTPLIEPASIPWKTVRLDGIGRYTYWVMPLQLVTQAGWFKLVGFGVVRMRAAGILWGLLALACWREIAGRLSADRRAAGLAVLLLATQYHFVSRAADGRMDMMCAALGAAGLAAYYRLRDSRFGAALFWANLCVAAAVLTHPNGALYGAALAIAAVYLDRRRLRWRHAALCAGPSAAALAGWGLYIVQAPALFAIQFAGNAAGRGPGWAAPWEALRMEVQHRYLEAFGMAAWTGGAARLGALVLVFYVAAAAYALWSGTARLALLSLGSAAVLFWGWEGLKSPLYLVHILPWFCLIAAAAVWRLRPPVRAAILAAVLALQTGKTAMAAWKDPYRGEYLPAAHFLAAHAAPTDLIMASAEMGYALGFERNIVDDVRLGYHTGKKPAWLVLDARYEGTLEALRTFKPEIYRYALGLIQAGYREVYRGPGYRIYRAW